MRTRPRKDELSIWPSADDMNLEVLERSAVSSAPAGDIRTTFLSTRWGKSA